MELRDYQRACLRALYERYRAGQRRLLVSLPTGTGKTVIFAAFPSFFRMKKRLLILAHRDELLAQAREKLLLANPNLKVEIERAEQHASAESDVVVASVPTLGRASSARLARLDPEQFFLLVVDEAHHATAPTYRRVLEHFGVFKPGSAKLLVGFTATPRRADSHGLNEVFQEIAFSRSLPEMVAAGFLAPLTGYRIETAIDLSRVRVRHGDFVPRGLSEAVNVQPRNALVAKVYRDLLAGKPALCFCVDVAHAREQAEAFRQAQIPAAAVVGEMEAEERRRALDEFRAGRLAVLTNCQVLTEGYDEPSVSGILLARPTKSALLYTQMIGRGTRLYPGKKHTTVIDIVDLSRTHRLVTLPTLFGLPARFDLAGHTLAQVREALHWVEAHRPWVREDLATSLDDLRYRCQRIDLLDLAPPAELARLGAFAWTACGPERYRLALPKGQSLRIAQNILGRWEVAHRGNQAETILSQHTEMHAAIAWSEGFVKERLPEALKLVKQSSAWRRQPATEKQLQVLRHRKIAPPAGLTRGQASQLISMLMGGP